MDPRSSLRRIRRGGLALLAALVLAHCSSDSPPPPNNATVLVYLIGTDLESGRGGMGGGNGTLNLTEMMRVGSTPTVTILVQTGGTKQWKTPLVSSATSQRFVVRPGTLQLLENLGQLNMGDPATLQEFLIWGMRSFPAQRFYVVLWDHGGGSLSVAPNKGIYGPDEFTGDALTLPQIVQAFQGAVSATGRTFEMIGFDACLMATVEVAQALSPFGKFLVASEELEPGAGWDWTPWLQTLVNNPAVDGGTVGRVIADSFLAKIAASDQAAAAAGKTQNEAPTVTLSVVDLSKVAAVMDRLGALAARILPILTVQSGATLASARLHSEDYGRGVPVDMVDLTHFTTNLQPSFPPEADQLLAALAQAVLYRVKGSGRPQADGLSFFFPYRRFVSRPNLQTDLQEFTASPFVANSYRTLVQNFSTIVFTDTTPPTFSNVAFNAGTFSATVDFSLYPGEVHVALTQDDPVNQTSLFLGMVPIDLQAGNVQKHEFTGQWVQLNSHLVSVFASNLQSKKNTYHIPAKLNGLSVELIAEQDRQTGDFTVNEAWPGVIDGVPSRESFPLKPGDVITPQFVLFNLVTDDFTLVDGQSFTVNGPVTLGETPLAAGQYHLRFYATDFAQNDDVSDFVTVSVP